MWLVKEKERDMHTSLFILVIHRSWSHILTWTDPTLLISTKWLYQL